MKKYLSILAFAALVLTGCQKEQFAEGELGGEPQEVTFSVGIPSAGLATKASMDNDGIGASTNRCIMEVYWNDQLYKREVKALSSADVNNKRTAEFKITVPTNRTYKVAFWADCATVDNSLEGFADKYYTTNDPGLTAVAFKGDYVGCNDAWDAFYACQEYTVDADNSSFAATLYRPFAQVNVITTDRAEFTLDGMGPDKVDVTFTAPKGMNLLTGALAEEAEITYTADVYKWADTYEYQSKTCATLAMDYIFAPAEDGAVIDVDFVAKNTSTSQQTDYTFSNVPYRRNYRTNIWGGLLTQSGKWNVTVDPEWVDEQDKEYVAGVVQDISELNTIISGNSDAKQYDFTFQATPADAGEPGSTANAILTTPLSEDSELNITVAGETTTLYVGDYESQSSTNVTSEGTKHAVVNITVPQGASIGTLVINAPSKSVYLNGQELASTGTLTNVDATTAASTLVVVTGQTISSLTIRGGGLEIHGSVGSVTVNQPENTENPVKVRTSENLSQSVYNALAAYLDSPSYSWKKNSNDTWDVVPSPVILSSAGNTVGRYQTVAQAVAAAGESENIIITLSDDITENAQISRGLILDLDGHTLTGKVSVTAGNVTITGNGTINAPYSAVSADGASAVVTIKNGTYTADDTGNVTLIHAVNGGTVIIEDGTFTGGKNGSGKEGKVFYAGSNSEADGNQNKHGTINISGGSFSGRISTSNWGVYNITGGTFDRNEVVLYNNPASGASTNTGTTGSLYDAGWIAEGYAVVANGDKFDVVEAGDKVACVGGLFYTLADGLAAAAGNKTLKLTADVDLTGVDWYFITSDNSGTVIDGQNHTISNMTTTNKTGKAAGFIAGATGWTVKNLNFVNATVTGVNWVGVVAGGAYCMHIDNCTVTNSSVTSTVANSDDGDKAGAIAGYLTGEPTGSITNCTAEGCTVKAYRDLGAIVGYANYNAVVTGNSASNCTVICDQTVNYKNYTTNAAYDANQIIGEKSGEATVSGNTATGVTVQYEKTINTKEQLTAFASSVNTGTSYAGTTIKLGADIDLGNEAWTMTCSYTSPGATFDGQNHTISNFSMSSEGKNVGFFGGDATGWNVKNLTISNASATGIGHVAILVGHTLSGTIENCTVKNSTVTSNVANNDDGDKAGAIAGYLSAENSASVTGCTVDGCSINAYRDLGAVVGYANYSAVVTGNVVKNSTVNCNKAVNYKNYTDNSQFDANTIVGEKSASATVENNTATDVTVNYNE